MLTQSELYKIREALQRHEESLNAARAAIARLEKKVKDLEAPKKPTIRRRKTA